MFLSISSVSSCFQVLTKQHSPSPGVLFHSVLPFSVGAKWSHSRHYRAHQVGLWENCPRNTFGWWKDYIWAWNILTNYASGAKNQLWREKPILIPSWYILLIHFQDEIFTFQENVFESTSFYHLQISVRKGSRKVPQGTTSCPFIFYISNAFLGGIPSLFPPLISNLEIGAPLGCELQVLQDKCR